MPRLNLSRFNNAGFSRGASKWKELLWWMTRSIFFASRFPLPSRVRVAALRCFGATVGSGVIIRSRVNITFPWRLSIGDHVWIGEEVSIVTLAEVRIESNCCISQRSFLCTGSHDFSKPTFDLITKPITIQEGSWVAAQCFVAPGVTVGPNSMCAAGCVVTKNVEPNTIVGGNPAKVIKRLEATA